MQIKKVIKGDEARAKLLAGFKTVADIVSTTAGPGGRNVALQESWGAPKVTKDGVTVAKAVTLAGAEGEGAKMILQASEKTNKNAGDGTTATCIFAKAIAEEGMKSIANGRKSTEIKRGIDKAVKDAVKFLKKHSKEIKTNEEIRQVATVSANNDTEIGDMIAKAVDKIGRDGVITVEIGRGLSTELEVVEGMQFDQGYLSPYFMTNPERQLVEFDNPLLFLYDGKINTMQSLVPLLEQVAQIGRPIVLIADEVDNEPLTTLVVNHLKGVLKCCAVKAPSFGDIRKFIMEDIATLTGGQFISTSLGINVEDINATMLGTCDKVKITPTETTIIGGHGDKEKIVERVAQLKEEEMNVESSYDKEKIRERIARLSNGIAVIKVGAATEVEVKEKKDRVDDAVCATRAALEEGILPGGGVSPVRAMEEMSLDKPTDMTPDEMEGYKIVLNSLPAQMKTIAENAGKSGEVVVEKIREKGRSYNFGYNAKNDTYCNMVEEGILDATKVVRCALENGASVAGTLLTVEGLVIDDIEENAKLMQLMRPQPQMGM